MARYLLFFAAVFAVYWGGFIYDETGPVLYSVMLAIIASSPLLLKSSFWKKIVLMVPLLVFRVIGKIFLIVFGRNALTRLLAKYGLLEERFNRTLAGLSVTRDALIEKWRTISPNSRAYLLLIFLPVGIVIFIVSLVIKIVRLKFLQFIIEKLMQKYFMKITEKAHKKLLKPESADRVKSDKNASSNNTPE